MTDNGVATRSLTVTWDDPLIGARQIPEMSGLEYIRSMMDGRTPPPPITQLMQFTLAEAEVGRVVFECTPNESQYNPIGTVHGGLACTLLDSAIGCAVQTTLPQGQGYTSVEIKVNYLRSILASSGTLRCEGTVIKTGARVAFAEAKITDAAGRCVATASSTCLVFALQ